MMCLKGFSAELQEKIQARTIPGTNIPIKSGLSYEDFLNWASISDDSAGGAVAAARRGIITLEEILETLFKLDEEDKNLLTVPYIV